VFISFFLSASVISFVMTGLGMCFRAQLNHILLQVAYADKRISLRLKKKKKKNLVAAANRESRNFGGHIYRCSGNLGGLHHMRVFYVETN